MKRVDTSIRTFRQATGLACFASESGLGIRPVLVAAEFNIDNSKHSP